MTRKEAVAALYRMWDAYWLRTHYEQPEQQAERQQIESASCQALLLLTRAIHGKAPLRGSPFLCDLCHLHYADGWEYEELGGLCEPCRAAQTVPPKKVGEVDACQSS